MPQARIELRDPRGNAVGIGESAIEQASVENKRVSGLRAIENAGSRCPLRDGVEIPRTGQAHPGAPKIFGRPIFPKAEEILVRVDCLLLISRQHERPGQLQTRYGTHRV